MGDSSNPDTLYHYCGAETFSAIVQSGIVRLSMLDMSNDSAEGSWLIEQVKLLAAAEPSLRAQIGFISNILEVSARDSIAAGFCMSANPDVLSQWRGYADNGAGFCIGFDVSKMRETIEAADKEFCVVEADARLVKVAYGIDAFNGQSARFLDSVAEGLELYQNAMDGGEVEKTFSAYVNFQMGVQFDARPIIDLRYIVKNPAFHEEEEWRIISHLPKDANEGGFKFDVLGMLEFAPNRGRVVPFAKLSLGSCISEVFLGPRNSTGVFYTQQLLGKFYARYIPVKKSEATYR